VDGALVGAGSLWPGGAGRGAWEGTIEPEGMARPKTR